MSWRVAAIAVVALLCSAFLPGIPIVLGTLILLAVALHLTTPALQEWLHPILRIPVAGRVRRHAHLTLIASGGVLLVVIGGLGARTSGHVRTEWQKRERSQSFAEQHGQEIIGRAREHLESGRVPAAELALMEVDGVLEVDPASRVQAEAMLEVMRQARDSEGILKILIQIPEAEFEAFAREEFVPSALEFEEHALTLQAIGLARMQLEDARRIRAEGALAKSDSL